MKIIVLHGDNTEKSYERLTDFIRVAKNRGWEILYDDLGVTPSLFGTEKLIVIREYKLITKKSLETLAKISGTLVIYSEGNLPATFLKLLPPDTKVEKLDLPKLIWNFLDKPSVNSLHEVVKNEPVEFIFALFARRIRDLYITPETYQPWQIGKLKSQRVKFTDTDLKEMIKDLSRIDIEAKTGRADLLSSLDLLIIQNIQLN
jgi:hypothetical protein